MKYPKLPVEFKEKWIAALRSGEYKKGTRYLKYSRNSNNVYKYCCLGVACEVVGAKNINAKHVIIEGGGIVGIRKVPTPLIGGWDENDLIDKLITMNDTGKSFKYIANWIEKNL